MPRARTLVIVPCYNEAARLPVEEFRKFRRERPDVAFTFVDDGSTDETPWVLGGLEERDPEAFRVVRGRTNQGKAGAVRLGMQKTLSERAEFAGYWDADLATPLDEIPRFVHHLEGNPGCQLVMGSRVKMLGRRIERSELRHYLGRVFATTASFALGIPVYDSQCGAKIFRTGPALEAVFDEPFRTNWAFDVEILARMLCARRAEGTPDDECWVHELPLRRWSDVPGSKVRPLDFFRGLAEVARIRRHYLGRHSPLDTGG